MEVGKKNLAAEDALKLEVGPGLAEENGGVDGSGGSGGSGGARAEGRTEGRTEGKGKGKHRRAQCKGKQWTST